LAGNLILSIEQRAARSEKHLGWLSLGDGQGRGTALIAQKSDDGFLAFTVVNANKNGCCCVCAVTTGVEREIARRNEIRNRKLPKTPFRKPGNARVITPNFTVLARLARWNVRLFLGIERVTRSDVSGLSKEGQRKTII
jgi:hypothetical protein